MNLNETQYGILMRDLVKSEGHRMTMPKPIEQYGMGNSERSDQRIEILKTFMQHQGMMTIPNLSKSIGLSISATRRRLIEGMKRGYGVHVKQNHQDAPKYYWKRDNQ